VNKRSRVLPVGLALNVVAALLLLSICQLVNNRTSWLPRGSIQHTKGTPLVVARNSAQSGTPTTLVVPPDSIQNATPQNTKRTTSVVPSNSIQSVPPDSIQNAPPQNAKGTTLIVPSSSIHSGTPTTFAVPSNSTQSVPPQNGKDTTLVLASNFIQSGTSTTFVVPPDSIQNATPQNMQRTPSIVLSTSIHSGTPPTFVVLPDSIQNATPQNTKRTPLIAPSNFIHSGTPPTFVVLPDSIQNATTHNTKRTPLIVPSNSIHSGTPKNGRGTTLVVPSSSIESAALQRLRFISARPSALHRTRFAPVQDVSFVYAESFRKGPTRVTESASEVVLTPRSPTCRIRVKDQAGKDRYELGCFPQQASETDPRITSWEIRLADLHHKIYTNVLASAVDPTRDATQIGWLDPGKFAKILITRERVIKIDGFYCTLQVKDYRFLNPDQPYLDRMTLVVHFTNSMPHMQVIPKEGSTGA
jgi:hypothetical protein